MVIPKSSSRRLLFYVCTIVLCLIALSWLLGMLPQLGWVVLIAFSVVLFSVAPFILFSV